MTLISAFMLTSCTGTTETPDVSTGNESQTTTTSQGTPVSASSTPTPAPTLPPTPTPEPGPAKVILSNSADSKGNTHFASSHYGLNITYTGEYITVMNYTTMMKHGDDIALVPEAVEGFEYQAEDLQYYNGLLYYLLYDWDNGVYYLYSYDFKNEPVKVCNSSVYHYEFLNGKIYFTKEFVQGPIYSMDSNGGSEMQITTMRAHSFVIDGQALYFYATDAGTAPGLVKYNLSTNEETTVVFPFYSHNYLVHNGYVYYVLDGTAYRSIHRMSLTDQTVSDIWIEMTDYTISLNISDGMLYILSGSSIYESSLDGSGRTKVYENPDSFTSGLYIFGDRIYATDGYSIIMVEKDGLNPVEFPFN